MNKFNYFNIIEQLKARNIEFMYGLTESDVSAIEAVYDIKFPRSLRDFYAFGLPCSFDDCRDFPIWTDFSKENTDNIRSRIIAPIELLKLDVKDGYWNNNWGNKPDCKDDSVTKFMSLVKEAPKLIPVFSHRYIPQIEGMDDPPILSVMGRDIVYYGSSLSEYLEREFLDNDCFCGNSIYIPFWSDIIRR